MTCVIPKRISRSEDQMSRALGFTRRDLKMHNNRSRDGGHRMSILSENEVHPQVFEPLL